jgi:NitT/TauT family transport system permease protein
MPAPSAPRSKQRDNIMKIATPAWVAKIRAPVFIGALSVLIWHTLASLTRYRAPHLAAFVPTPAETARDGMRLIATSDFWLSFLASNFRVLAAFTLSALLAIPVGTAMGVSAPVRRLFGALFDFGRYLPVAAFVPLTILWAGVGDLQKILVLTMGTFFQLLVLTADAVRRVPDSHIDAARTLGVHGRQLTTKVVIPAALPEIYDACRVCIGLTWSWLIVAEIVASERGIGYIVIRSQRFLQTGTILFTIAVMGLIGVAYDRAFTVTRGWLFPWFRGGSD